MNNDSNNNDNTRGVPFSHSFNFGTTIQNVFRNINHVFANNHDSSGGDDNLQDRAADVPPLVSLNSADGRGDARPTGLPLSSSPAPDPLASSTSLSTSTPPPPPSQPDSQRDDEDGDSIPELRSVSDSSDDSDAGFATLNPQPSRQDAQPVDGEWTDDERDLPPLEPIAGTRRARVDDDGDDARDRRHPSERVGGPLPAGDAPPQSANPQQPPHPPPGLFGALFGFAPPGGAGGAGDAPPEHVHTGEGTADPLPAGNNATPGHTRRGGPMLTAGFTLSIPLFGPQANRAGAAGGQGVPVGMSGMDAATREELLASFAAFFQEFQAMEEGREDPERAKKLLAGLELVPLGLVKRLERVGGAPGGHAGDSTTEGSSSGCAICWDTLLDAENDGFRAQQPSGGDTLQSSSSSTDAIDGHTATHTNNGAMDVDAPSASASQSGPSTSTPPSPELPKIISLPCAHVFHSTCLLPWFTRARQATCPTCRFNIDPENLTYTPRRAFTRAPPAQPGNAGPNAAPANPETGLGAPQEAPSTADAAAPAADPARATAGLHPEAVRVPNGPPPPPRSGQAGLPPVGLGFNPFAIPAGQAGVPLTGLGFNPFAPPTGQAGAHPTGPAFNPFIVPAGQTGGPAGAAFGLFGPPTGQSGAPPAGVPFNPFAIPTGQTGGPAGAAFGLFGLPTDQAGAPPAGAALNPFAIPTGQAGAPPAGAAFGLFRPPTGQAGVPHAGAAFNPFAGPAGAAPTGEAFNPFVPLAAGPPPAGAAPDQAGAPPTGQAFAPFAPVPGIPILSFPAIQIPLRPTAGQAVGDGNQGVDVLTIGLDMFLGGPPPGFGGDPRDNADGVNGAPNGGPGVGTDGAANEGPDVGAAGGNGPANPNVLAHDLHALIDSLVRATRNIIPQMMNAQGQGPVPAPAPAADARPADGVPLQSQPGQALEAGGPQPAPQPVPPLPNGARFVPMPPLRPNMFRPTRPMPPRRERKAWILPPAPGLSLRQRVEQREQEQGLRCSDTSCGVGPSDDEPFPDPSVPMTKQISIHALSTSDHDSRASVCAHAFHPACLVSAERVAGWGGEDKTEPLVEVSCPVCRAVGCMTRDEWELGVSALIPMDLCC